MSKKSKSLLKLTVSLAMVVTLCFSMALIAVADDHSVGTEAKPAEAAITKILTMAEGLTTPQVSFTFSITSKTVDDAIATASNMPIVGANTNTATLTGTKSIDFTADDVGKTENGVKNVAKEVLGDVFAGVTWPHAGLYIYTVKEVEGSYTGITYSKAVYDVWVYVANKADGSGVYVAGIGAYLIINDGEEPVQGEPKVDPTPGGDPKVEGDYSHLAFTNKYIKQGGGDPEVEDNWMLGIKKTVVGPSGTAGLDFADRTKYFDFKLLVNKPANITEDVKYKAYVVEEAPAAYGKAYRVVTSTENYPGIKTDAYGQYIEINPGTEINPIKLRHGQYLVFTDMHYGATYAATEFGVPDYLSKVDIIVGGATPPIELTASGADLSTGVRIISDKGINRAFYTNTYKTVTPTGISVDNLPYIVMIAVVLATLAGFVVFKLRRRANCDI